MKKIIKSIGWLVPASLIGILSTSNFTNEAIVYQEKLTNGNTLLIEPLPRSKKGLNRVRIVNSLGEILSYGVDLDNDGHLEVVRSPFGESYNYINRMYVEKLKKNL